MQDPNKQIFLYGIKNHQISCLRDPQTQTYTPACGGGGGGGGGRRVGGSNCGCGRDDGGTSPTAATNATTTAARSLSSEFKVQPPNPLSSESKVLRLRFKFKFNLT